jgi:hypothetical protein
MEVSAAPYKAARSWQMESAPTPADLPSKINSPPRARGMAEQHQFNNVRSSDAVCRNASSQECQSYNQSQ